MCPYQRSECVLLCPCVDLYPDASLCRVEQIDDISGDRWGWWEQESYGRSWSFDISAIRIVCIRCIIVIPILTTTRHHTENDGVNPGTVTNYSSRRGSSHHDLSHRGKIGVNMHVPVCPVMPKSRPFLSLQEMVHLENILLLTEL